MSPCCCGVCVCVCVCVCVDSCDGKRKTVNGRKIQRKQMKKICGKKNYIRRKNKEGKGKNEGKQGQKEGRKERTEARKERRKKGRKEEERKEQMRGRERREKDPSLLTWELKTLTS